MAIATQLRTAKAARSLFSRRSAPAAIVIALCAICGAPSPAAAEILVVESWVGGPSPQEQGWAAALRSLLAKADGVVSSPTAVSSALGMRRPLPALQDLGQQRGLVERLMATRAALNEALGQYRQGRFLGAEKRFAEVVSAVRQNPLVFAAEIGRPIVRQSLVYLMMARSRLRQTAAAAEVAEELVRTFPNEAEKVFVDFGPLADKQYRAAEAKLSSAGRGTLVVEIDDRDAVVSVNEGLGASKAFEKSVFPGTYRVLVKTPSAGARRYDVLVRPNETSRLTVDWRLDSVLSFSSDSVALIFDSDRARASEGVVAASLGRAIAAGDRVAIIGTRLTNGYRALSASIYDVATGAHRVTALALMDGARLDAKLQSLRDFIASAGAARDSEILISQDPLETVARLSKREQERDRDLSPRWPAYAAGAAAVAAFGAGVWTLEGARQDCIAACERPSNVTGYVLFGASTVLAFYAATRWGRRASKRGLTGAVSVASDGAGVTLHVGL